MPEPARGEIWPADLTPVREAKTAGRHLILIVSTNLFNEGAAGVVFALPLTRVDRQIPVHIPVDPPEGGLLERGFILCDALQAVAKARLGPAAIGRVAPQTMRRVEDHLRILLDL